MARTIYTTGGLTDEQIDGLYALAEEFGVGICLWGNTPGPNRESFTWAVTGGFLQVRRFMPNLKALK
ncbi:hypothetical protein AB0B01_12515 [Streptomyces sp. NPDC044571]|uniref:hypothetical protein n=1 Tax=Streptomyces sp. NPDC044571 TaxID=3155371 RepID=UPI0033F4DA02